MRTLRNRLTLLSLAILIAALCGLPAIGHAQSLLPPLANGPTSTEFGVVNEATAVLQELIASTATQIPEQLLASAAGVVIVPHYVRGAFVIGVAGGRGVLSVRDANGYWQAPEFITLGGGSVGWQVGVQATDLVLVFRTPQSLNHIRTGKLTLGANASAAAGPVGRYASAATDAGAQAEIFTYSKSRGLFAGVALDGASLQIDIPATQVFYQTSGGGPGVVPSAAISLVNELNHFSRTVPPPTPSTRTGGNVEATPIGNFSAAKVRINPGGLKPLEDAVSVLLGNVDNAWKLYLALPTHWQNASEISSNEIYSILSRYERVATNPQFAALRTVPAFEKAIAELRGLAAQVPEPAPLQLPPPPAMDANDPSRGRY